MGACPSTLAVLKAAQLTAHRYTVYNQSREVKAPTQEQQQVTQSEDSTTNAETEALSEQPLEELLVTLKTEVEMLSAFGEEMVRQLQSKEADMVALQERYNALQAEHQRLLIRDGKENVNLLQGTNSQHVYLHTTHIGLTCSLQGICP